MYSFHSNTVRTQAVSLKAMKIIKWPISTKSLKELFWLFVSEDPKDGEGKNCHPTMEVRLRGKHEQKSSCHQTKPLKGWRDCDFRSQRSSLQTGALCFQKLHHFLLPQQRAVLRLHQQSSFCDPTSFPWNSLASLSKGKTLSSPESLSP